MITRTGSCSPTVSSFRSSLTESCFAPPFRIRSEAASLPSVSSMITLPDFSSSSFGSDVSALFSRCSISSLILTPDACSAGFSEGFHTFSSFISSAGFLRNSTVPLQASSDASPSDSAAPLSCAASSACTRPAFEKGADTIRAADMISANTLFNFICSSPPYCPDFLLASAFARLTANTVKSPPAARASTR